METYLKVLRNFSFRGRSSRKEYWIFMMVNSIIFTSVGLLWLIFISDSFFGIDNEYIVLAFVIITIVISILSLVYAIILIIPILAVTVRRLHDVGISGWMILIFLIPFIGAIWLLVQLMLPSNLGKNQYGPRPIVANNKIEKIA